MKADFSEFSYGFALTSEIVDEIPQIRHAGAPRFPSLYEEGQAGGGYDVEIPIMGLFLQFKLSDELTRRNAKEANLLGLSYFRMELRPLRHSDQHKLLLDLDDGENMVFYVAPEFRASRDLNLAYASRNVAQRSAFFSPKDIGSLPDDGRHYVVFTTRTSDAYLCSEPHRVRRTRVEEIFKLASARKRRPEEAELTKGEDFYTRLVTKMLDAYAREGRKLGHGAIEQLRRLSRDREPAPFAQYLSQTLFDCELLVVGAQEG